MVFSSLATDLSANSARVSACNTKPCNTSDKSAEEVLICFLTCLTSFSFSVSTLISSSYLSSFCEYCSTSTEQHHQHTSVTAHRGGKKQQHNNAGWRHTDTASVVSSSDPTLPSQPGPPVTSGCWWHFSTLLQGHLIYWRSRERGETEEEKKTKAAVWNKEQKMKRRSNQPRVRRSSQHVSVAEATLGSWVYSWKTVLYLKTKDFKTNNNIKWATKT